MKYLLVGILLTSYSFAFAQGSSENPLKNSRNYKTSAINASKSGSKVLLTNKKTEGRNYKKAKSQNIDSQSFNGNVQSAEQSMESRKYKN